MNIITGEKIQNKCDYYIGSLEDFNYNPNIKPQLSKHININNYNIELIKKLNIQNIFCYTHILLHNCDSLIIILSNISTKFNIFFHNSDQCFNIEHKNILQLPNLQKIFTQNLSIEPEENIIPLPIGIANSMWRHGNLNIWSNVLSKINIDNKLNYIYFNFNINTNISKRKICYDIVILKNIPNIPNTDYLNYLNILASYKFAICPEGNGIDTHRMWECIYLKVIPICLKNTITTYYSNIFPLLLVNNWNDISNDITHTFFINAKWDNYNMLNMSNNSNIIS